MTNTVTRKRQTSPTDRAGKIVHATRELPTLVAQAVAKLNNLGPDHPDTLRAWELVEVHGATIHRQSRLLAGKSKGG